MEHNKFDNAYNEKSWKELLTEIGKLILKLIWRILLRIIKLTVKGIKWCSCKIAEGTRKLIDWWNDNSTQAKVRIIRLKTRALMRLLIKWGGIALRESWSFIVSLSKKIVKGIIDMKPTVIAIKNAIVNGSKNFAAWIKKQIRKTAYNNAKRKVRYRKFRKRPGFKGLLTDIGDLLKTHINSYLEEEQTEFTPEAPVSENSDTPKGSKARIFGDKLITSVKDIVDSE
jgi:hypothetical protein